MTLEVEVLDSIANTRRDFLDDRCKDPILSYEWLLSLEHSLPLKILPRHIVLYNKGQTVALLPCFLQFEELYSTVEDRIFGRIKPWVHRMGIKLFPALVAYVPLMYKSAFIIDEHLDQNKAIETVLATMDKVARQEKAKIYGFSYLTKNQSFLADLLRKKSFNISLAVPNTYIEINWKNFDGYIDYLKKNHQNMAKNVLKEIRKNKNAGIHIEKISGFSHLADQFACLFGETYYRHTRKKSELTKQFFQNISSHGNDIANAYCAFKGDTLRAFSIVLEGKDIWHSLLSGQNYEADRQDSSFFNVVFYAPIREAIRNNARRIYFGPANYEAKLRRGCLIEPLSMCFKSSNTCINKLLSYWFRITEIWYQRKYQELLLPKSH